MNRFTVSVVSSVNGIGEVVVALRNLCLGGVRRAGTAVSVASGVLLDFVPGTARWAFDFLVVAAFPGSSAADVVRWLVAWAVRRRWRRARCRRKPSYDA